jgi:hypothetical protein
MPDIYIKIKTMEDTKKAIDDFLDATIVKDVSEDGKEQTVCDKETGECYVIRSKDGLVERINKKYITEDGRQLLQD